jgi:hypothetical protein
MFMSALLRKMEANASLTHVTTLYLALPKPGSLNTEPGCRGGWSPSAGWIRLGDA